ncbi:MAG: hypothetical protein FWC50_16380, partial [Planctomycetaceae bacterium]|nr:hypothetical protein [Planctomycetaceae bacterium]
MTHKCVFKYCVLWMTLALVSANGLQTAFAQSASEKKNKVKVLVVTGIEYHVWQETAPQIAKQLASCPELDVKLEPDYNILCTDKIFDYDVIFFNFCNLREYASTKD